MPQDEPSRRKTIDVLYDMTWSDGRGITDPQKVAAALDAAGLRGDELVEQATSPDGKARVREQTDAAVASGVFGVPTVEIDGEQFWGQDAFPHVERFVEGNDPVTAEAVSRWADLPASSQRKP